MEYDCQKSNKLKPINKIVSQCCGKVTQHIAIATGEPEGQIEKFFKTVLSLRFFLFLNFIQDFRVPISILNYFYDLCYLFNPERRNMGDYC